MCHIYVFIYFLHKSYINCDSFVTTAAKSWHACKQFGHNFTFVVCIKLSYLTKTTQKQRHFSCGPVPKGSRNRTKWWIKCFTFTLWMIFSLFAFNNSWLHTEQKRLLFYFRQQNGIFYFFSTLCIILFPCFQVLLIRW